MDEIILKQLQTLPKELRDHITSGALNVAIEDILKDHPLQNVQKEAFELEVMLVLLQLESLESFTVNIKHKMEIAMKRAEDISKKTKQLIFLPVQDLLVQSAALDEGRGEGPVSDGVIAQPEPKKEVREIPLVDTNPQRPEPELNHPIVAPTPAEVTPAAKEKVLEAPQAEGAESLDIFKKRLQQPVHTPVEENQVGDTGREIGNVNPSSKESIENDPYKESF